MSVTEPTVPVPDAREMTTVAPPADRALPYWSFAVTVKVTVEPSAVTELDAVVSVDCAAEAVPTCVVSADDVPVRDVLSVAVIVRVRADVVGTV